MQKKTTAIPKQKFLDWYKKLAMIRQFEEKADELFREGKIYGTIHNSIGQEAIAVGVAEALEEDDLVIARPIGPMGIV
jgi:pyruvate dehydrogenase E1 component alpha subunit